MQNSMSVCPHCGNQISADDQVCKACGKSVEEGPASAPRQAAPAHPPATLPRKRRSSRSLLAGLAGGALICVACLCVALLGGGAYWWNQPEPTEFSFGPIQTYPVAAAKNTQITDSVTGYTLRFPEGGSGNLQIARITSGPAAPLGGEGIHVEYEGNTPIQLVLKDPGSGSRMVVMGYGFLPGAYVENQWIALHQGKVVNGWITVDLVMPFELPVSLNSHLIASLDPGFGLGTGQFAFQAPPRKKVGFHEYHIAQNNGLPIDIKIGRQIAENLQRMLDTLLPTGIYYSATANQSRLSPFEVDPYVFGKGNNYIFSDKTTIGEPYYTGFGGIYGNRFPQPIIHINPKDPILAQSLAHETGHYITHILVGDDTYKTLEGQSPLVFGTDHAIGKRLSGRQSFYLEEPAYFAEYFLTGLVGGHHPDTIRQTLIVGGSTIPSTYDFPSVEGFGFLMLQSLHRQEKTIQEPNRRYAAEVPVVGASYGEIFEIISQGATGTDQLLEHIQKFLVKKGGDNPQKLSALAERNGWRYNVRGRLLDVYGDPVSGVMIESISRVGCKDYKAGVMDQPTRTDGKFKIDEVFPGDSILRVTGPLLADGVTQVKFDIPIKIDWAKPTNQDVDLGDLKLGRMQMFFNETQVDLGENVKGSPGKATFKATAIGIPPTVKSLQWSFEYSGDGISETKVFLKNSKVQATETQMIEVSIPANVSTYHHEDETDFGVRVFLLDLTCGSKQPLDMGIIGVNVTDEFPPATEVESHSEATPRATVTPTETPTPAPTGTSAPACTGTLRGTVLPDKVACYYGPGSMYLYFTGIRVNATRDLIGRDDLGNWVLTRARGDNKSCWIKTDKLKLTGDVMCLEAIHPDNFHLPRTTFYGPLTGVNAARSGNNVVVSWNGITLRPDLDSLQTPYVIEAWVCRGGKFFFEPTGSYSTTATIVDEGGCSERSHGRVMAAEKHGYTKWVEIPWP